MILNKVLILESEYISQELLKTFFIGNELQITGSSIEAFKILKSFHPNIIIINSTLGGLNGYDTCELLIKSPENKNIPIIFLSDNPSLEEKQRVYGLGAFSYISKPYDIHEFKNKIDQAIATNTSLINLTDNITNLQGELDLSYSSVLNIQHNLSLMQYIVEFLQNSLFCHDYQSLFKLLFSTINKFGSSCVLFIQTDTDSIIQSENGIIHEIEHEIIKIPVAEKITLFGNNRALFSWPSVRLLVRNIHDNSDYFSYLMEGIEATVKAINTEGELLTAVDNLQDQNYQSQKKASNLFTEMNMSLKETFLSLGFSSLSQDEEDRLNDCVDSYSEQILQLLTDIGDNNDVIKGKINKLKKSEVKIIDEEDNEIDFF